MHRSTPSDSLVATTATADLGFGIRELPQSDCDLPKPQQLVLTSRYYEELEASEVALLFSQGGLAYTLGSRAIGRSYQTEDQP
jgi:hypothetical protein